MRKLSTKFYPTKSNNISKRLYNITRWDSSQIHKDGSTYTNQSSYTTLTKVKSHMIIATDAEEEFDKVQHHFMIKTLTKVGIEGIFLNIIKATYNKHTANIIFNGEKLKGFH